jgi:hypothetical protein
MFFIDFRVTRRKFDIQLIVTAIDEARAWYLLLLKIRDQLTRDQMTRDQTT